MGCLFSKRVILQTVSKLYGCLFSKRVILQTVSKLYGCLFSKGVILQTVSKLYGVSFQQGGYSTDSVKIIWLSFQQGGLFYTQGIVLKNCMRCLFSKGLFYRQCQNYMGCLNFSARGIFYSIKIMRGVFFQDRVLLRNYCKDFLQRVFRVKGHRVKGHTCR